MIRMSSDTVLVIVLFLVVIVVMSVVLSFPSQRTSAIPSSNTINLHHRSRAQDKRQTLPDNDCKTNTKYSQQIASPQANPHITDDTLPSYVESRSVLWKGNRENMAMATEHDEAFSYAQTNNHQPYSTQGESIVEQRQLQLHRPATTQPRVNVWNSKLCGLYV